MPKGTTKPYKVWKDPENMPQKNYTVKGINKAVQTTPEKAVATTNTTAKANKFKKKKNETVVKKNRLYDHHTGQSI